MAQPAETVTKVFYVMDGSGAAVTGLVLGSFTITAYKSGVVYTHSSTITEIGSGFYKWTYLNPSTLSHRYITIVPTTAAYRCTLVPNRSIGFEGEVENNDLDSIYAGVVRPISTLLGAGTIGTIQPITLYANRYRKIQFSFVDQSGVPITLASSYNNWKFSVRSADQTTTKWNNTDASAGTITPLDTGVLTVEFPETAAFYAALAVGATQPLSLYWEATADFNSDATKTVPVIPSSPVQLSRVEVGT